MDIYNAGLSYEVDQLMQARRHARFCQWVAVVAVAMAALFGAGYAFVASQHTVTSHVVKVDKSSGLTEVVQITNLRDVPMQGLEAMAAANHYVAARERYNHGIIQVDYTEVVAQTDDSIVGAYDDEIRGAGGKLARFKSGIEERVDILNVTLPPDQVGRAVVRFKRTTLTGGNPETAQSRTYQVTLAYYFAPSPTGRKETLLVNPLGFKVSAYIVEPELGGR